MTCRECSAEFDPATVPRHNGRPGIRCRACLREYNKRYKLSARIRPRRHSLLAGIREHAVKSETLGIWLRTLRSGEPER